MKRMNTMNTQRILLLAFLGVFGLLATAQALDQYAQWDFNGNLNSSVAGGQAGNVESGVTVTFKTATLPDGTANVAEVSCDWNVYLNLPFNFAPNGGQTDRLAQFTVISDMMIPDTTADWEDLQPCVDKYPIAWTWGAAIYAPGYITGWVEGPNDVINGGEWYRVVYAVDKTKSTGGVGWYLNGQLAGTADDTNVGHLLPTTHSEIGYKGYISGYEFNSIQIVPYTLTEAEIVALGGPKVAGIPVPAVPKVLSIKGVSQVPFPNQLGSAPKEVKTATVIIGNAGYTQPVHVTAITSGTMAAEFTVTPTSTITLDPGTTATLTVTWDPTVGGTVPNPAVGARDVELALTHDDGRTANPQMIKLGGTIVPSITTDLVAHLKFDGNANDSSGRGNTPTASGSPTYLGSGNGVIGDAISLHGSDTDDFLTFGKPADLQFGAATDFTISVWCKLAAENRTDWGVLISNKNWYSGSNTGWILSTGSGTDNEYFTWNIKAVGSGRQDFWFTPALGADWHLLTTTVQRTGDVATYLDGALRTRAAMRPGTVDADLDTAIGTDGTLNTDYCIRADIDDVGIWRRALAPEEVAGVYTYGLKGQDLSQPAATAPVLTSPTDGATGQNPDYVSAQWEHTPYFTTEYRVYLTSGTAINTATDLYTTTSVSVHEAIFTGLEASQAYKWRVDTNNTECPAPRTFTTGARGSRPTVTINQASTTLDPTSVLPVEFDIVFSEGVTGLTPQDIAWTGSVAATSITTSLAPLDPAGTRYRLSVTGFSDTLDGSAFTLVPTVPALAAITAFGNPNLDSTSTDNSVTFDKENLGVTIVSNDGPVTNAATVTYRVTFTEPVMSFTSATLSLAGTIGDASIEQCLVVNPSTAFDVVVNTGTTDGQLALVLTDDDTVGTPSNDYAQWDFNDNLLSSVTGGQTATVDAGVTLGYVGTTIDGQTATVAEVTTGGSDKYVNLPFNFSPNGGQADHLGQFTVISDMKNPNATGWGVLQPSINSLIMAWTWDDYMYISGYVSGWVEGPHDTMNAGDWNRVVMTVDKTQSTGGIKYYFNGLLAGSCNDTDETNVSSLLPTTGSVIGASDYGDYVENFQFNSIQFLPYPLSAAEVVALGGPKAAGIPDPQKPGKVLNGTNTGGAVLLYGNTLIVDKTPPTVVSIKRAFGAPWKTVSPSVLFEVTFSDAVTGVDAADFTLNTADVTINRVSGAGNTWYVNCLTGTYTGELSLAVKSDATLENAVPAGYVAGTPDPNQTYLVGAAPVPTAASSWMLY